MVQYLETRNPGKLSHFRPKRANWDSCYPKLSEWVFVDTFGQKTAMYRDLGKKKPLTSLPSCLLICGYIPLTDPKDKQEDKVACWCSAERSFPGTEKNVGKGGKWIQIANRRGPASMHVRNCSLQILTQWLTLRRREGTRSHGPALRLWATLLSSLGFLSGVFWWIRTFPLFPLSLHLRITNSRGTYFGCLTSHKS